MTDPTQLEIRDLLVQILAELRARPVRRRRRPQPPPDRPVDDVTRERARRVLRRLGIAS